MFTDQIERFSNNSVGPNSTIILEANTFLHKLFILVFLQTIHLHLENYQLDKYFVDLSMKTCNDYKCNFSCIIRPESYYKLHCGNFFSDLGSG